MRQHIRYVQANDENSGFACFVGRYLPIILKEMSYYEKILFVCDYYYMNPTSIGI